MPNEFAPYPHVKLFLATEIVLLGERNPKRKPSDKNIAEISRLSRGSISNYRRGNRCPDEANARKLSFAFYPETEYSDFDRAKFVSALLEAGQTREDVVPVLPNRKLNVKATAFPPFSGSRDCFLDNLIARFFAIADIRTELPPGGGTYDRIETRDLSSGDLLIGLWDSLDRVVSYNLVFFRIPVRMTLGGCTLARFHKRIPAIAKALSQPSRPNSSQPRIAPIVVSGEVGHLHCRNRLGFPPDTLHQVDDLNPILLAQRLRDRAAATPASVPVICVDDLTAMRVQSILGDDGCLVFDMNTRSEIQQTAARRELPQYYLSIAARSRDRALVDFLTDSIARFLSTEIESTAYSWFNLATKLAEEILGNREGLARKAETDFWADVFGWIRYTLFLDTNSIESLSPSMFVWQPILRRARQLLHTWLGHKDSLEAVTNQVRSRFTEGQISFADIRQLCVIFDVELDPKLLRPERYRERPGYLISILRIALRGQEPGIRISEYDASDRSNSRIQSALERLTGDLVNMYQILGEPGSVAVRQIRSDMAARESIFGGPTGAVVIARLEEEDEFVGGLCLTALGTTRCEIRYLWVDPSFRGSATASLLITRAIRMAGRRHSEVVNVEIIPKLHAAIHFFVAHGFVYTGLSPDGCNQYVLQLKAGRPLVAGAV